MPTKDNSKEISIGIPSIGIPAEVLFHPKLTPIQKILFGFIRNLSQTEKGCWASNSYLGRLLKKKPQTISNAVSNLNEHRFIKIRYKKKPDGTTTRYIFINNSYPKIYRKLVEETHKTLNDPLLKNLYPPIKKLIDPYKKINTKDAIEEDIDKKEIFSFKTFLKLFPKEWQGKKSFQTNLEEYWKHRKEMNKKPTKRAGIGLANKLTKYSIQIATIALTRSVENCWVGVFPESVNEITHQKYGLDVLEKWCEENQTRPSDKEIRRLELSEKPYKEERARLWTDIIPYPSRIAKDYDAWLYRQSWLKSVEPEMYHPNHKLFHKFLKEQKEDYGVSIITGG